MRHPRLLPIALALVTLLPAGLAAADSGDAGGSSASADEVTTYTFGDDLVTGDYAFPMAERLHVRSRSGRRTLVRPREHFVPELLESAENL